MLVLAQVSSDEYQAPGVKPALISLPPDPAASDVGAILLAGVQRFFKRDPLVLEEAPHRPVARRRAALGQLGYHRPQGQVRFLGNPRQQPFALGLQP
jgi:hypothetical protein